MDCNKKFEIIKKPEHVELKRLTVTNRQELEKISDTIEHVMSQAGLPGRIMGGSADHRVIKLDMATRSSMTAMNQAGLPGHLAAQLGTHTVRLYREGANYCIEIPLQASRLLRLTQLREQVESLHPMTAVLGADAAQCPLLARIDKMGHLLITGDTRAGKTSLMRTLLASLALSTPIGDMKMTLIDPKERGLGPLAVLPHAGNVISGLGSINSQLAILATIVGRRLRTREKWPVYIVAIDELADLPQGHTQSFLSVLIEKGAQVGVHVIAGTRRPTSYAEKFPIRALGAVANVEDAPAHSGAKKLVGRGDFLLSASGEYMRFQAAWLGSKELASIVNDIERMEKGLI